MWQQVFAVFLVIGLLVVTLALLRRKGLAQFPAALRGSSSRSREMHVLERIPLGPHHSLHLVNVRDSVFLIGVGPSGCNKIDVFAVPEPVAAVREERA